jgi:Zn-finger nucleic acid-binding protein
VRYTSDPASLAEALLVIRWQRGAVTAVPRVLAPLYLAPVGIHRLDWRRYLETHPPLEERIGRLQVLAERQGQRLWERRDDLARRLQAREHAAPPRAPLGASATATAGASESTAALPPGRAARLAAAPIDAALCPHCGGVLRKLLYEGSAIVECVACGGVGATTGQTQAILVRRDWGFTPEQLRMADMIEHLLEQPPRAGGRRPDLPWSADREPGRCPFCDGPLRRAPWSLAYPLPTDFCAACDLHWFDRDEIEILQILVERGTDAGASES